jgi:hypothetical protein
MMNKIPKELVRGEGNGDSVECQCVECIRDRMRSRSRVRDDALRRGQEVLDEGRDVMEEVKGIKTGKGEGGATSDPPSNRSGGWEVLGLVLAFLFLTMLGLGMVSVSVVLVVWTLRFMGVLL